MTAPSRFPVVFLWHMHQPEYRVDGRFRLPWVHLHAIGAYSDMAAHLEAEPGMRAVVNFSLVLIDQLVDIAERLRLLASERRPAREALLDALISPPPAGPDRAALIRRCLPEHVNPRVERVKAYLALVEELRAPDKGRDFGRVSDAILRDLIILFHLSWLGDSVRRDRRAQALVASADGRDGTARGIFDAADAQMLLQLMADTVGPLLKRYRALADAGRIELSMTPYYHPLLPLLADFSSARDAAPDVALPDAAYPGGLERNRWHLAEGWRRFNEVFGRRPDGCWPSEAAVSEVSLRLIADEGFAWVASSQRVLQHTLDRHGMGEANPFRAYRPATTDDEKTAADDETTGGGETDGKSSPADELLCYFRYDYLADRIGFAYKDWPARDAVRDLVGELEQIAAAPGRDLALVALDGENPWEWYPDNGQVFLGALYRALAAHPRLRPATLAACRAAAGPRAVQLPPLQAGSWVDGQLLTWIGHPEKNRVWTLLVEAKRRFDAAISSAAERPEPMASPVSETRHLQHLLGACEGSDWLWWPGEANPAASVADFDALFRLHVAALYRGLGETPPAALASPLSSGTPALVPAGGIMKPSGSERPTDGEPSGDRELRRGRREGELLAPWIGRSAGVLLDVASLPSGVMDEDARRFVDLVADAGFSIWQLLPVGPRDTHGNPFQPPSAFAGDAALLPPGVGLVGRETGRVRDEPHRAVDVDRRYEPAGYAPSADLAGSIGSGDPGGAFAPAASATYATFVAENGDWLEDWALFIALKEEQGGAAWWTWPAAIRDRAPAALEMARARLAAAVERERQRQFAFDASWMALKRHAAAGGLKLLGDVPLFVASDSADVWAHRELFEVEADGASGATVGVPPDAFSAEGQMWSYPPYRWEAMADQGFRWWRRRFEVQARRFDLLRLDHFRGFAAWWRLPAGASHAAEGRWVAGPGAAAIDVLRPVLGDVRLVAEDLGVITPDVVALRKRLGLPGMRVLQFGFDGDPENLHLPQRHGPDTICYTGTHDNDTTLGWWLAASEAERGEVRRQLGAEHPPVPQALVDCAWASAAPLAVVPMQDLLGLGSEARTNRPGIAEGNWAWRFRWEQVPADFSPRMCAALARHGRLSRDRRRTDGP